MSFALQPGSVIPFLRRRDYTFVRVLGRGACGETVLLRDDLIDSHFVCKKYSPIDESLRQELFRNFLREIKLLHELHHQNVVRVFNYYVYPDKCSGYILMEYVQGLDIEQHLATSPEAINQIFGQVVDGFCYLEASQILHRDIRPQNLLVRNDGVLKIIDLGFSKRIETATDFDKSISLNWWCEPPLDFAVGTYDHATEVYFVGKLFEKLIGDRGIEQFKHPALLDRMCRRNPRDRVASFQEVRSELNLRRSDDIEFENYEREAYRDFAAAVSRHITKIEESAKYATDLHGIRVRLEALYRNCMLEDALPDCAPLLQVLVSGQYFYRASGFQTGILRNFLGLLRSAAPEKQGIALANLHARLDAIKRYKEPTLDDDIPF